jgi:hypothetical protein
MEVAHHQQMASAAELSDGSTQFLHGAAAKAQFCDSKPQTVLLVPLATIGCERVDSATGHTF